MKENQCVLSIFGATGDLAKRKLLPALYYLEQENLLDENFCIVCIGRKEKSIGQYREEACQSIKIFSRIGIQEPVLERLALRIYYHRLDFSNEADFLSLGKLIWRICKSNSGLCNRIFYLAVPSEFFGAIAKNLKASGIAGRESRKTYNRVVFEKPFGSDLKSSRELNKTITGVFDEKQIYRIDHYMAKEIVQNLLVLRFANIIFEPLWNKNYIDHIQITVAESLGMEGRGAYYEKAGALRDVLQNHMLQLLALVAMDEPRSFNGENIKNEKIKVLKSVSMIKKSGIDKSAVAGQYGKGIIEDKNANAYNEEPNVDKNSQTETYFALKIEINNKMWKGVPFYLRTGKRLKERATEIVIVYKDAPFGLFSKSDSARNMMVIRVQPYDGITLKFNAKVPGKKIIIDSVDMDFCHECKFGPNSPESYEKLLYDVMQGDQTLFTRWDEVENAWKIVDGLINTFKNIRPFKYEAGTWGPINANRLLQQDGREWVVPTKPSYAEFLGKK